MFKTSEIGIRIRHKKYEMDHVSLDIRYLKSHLKSHLEIHSKSPGDISHIVCELKENEIHNSSSFKSCGVVGGWVHLDYNVSSAPFSVAIAT